MAAELLTSRVRDYLVTGPDYATAFRAIWRYDIHTALENLLVTQAPISGVQARIGFTWPRASAALPNLAEASLPDATDFVANADPELSRCLMSNCPGNLKGVSKRGCLPVCLRVGAQFDAVGGVC